MATNCKAPSPRIRFLESKMIKLFCQHKWQRIWVFHYPEHWYVYKCEKCDKEKITRIPIDRQLAW